MWFSAEVRWGIVRYGKRQRTRNDTKQMPKAGGKGNSYEYH